MSLSIVILAAGQGTRMRSNLPKVLHRLAGKTLLEHVCATAARLDHDAIYVVYGYGGEQVPDSLARLPVNWIRQEQQLGTGHAMQQAMAQLEDAGRVLILYGDVPLITQLTLERLVQASTETGLGLLTSHIDDPSGYGRIVRDAQGNISAIVEDKDADEAQRRISEINTGMMAVATGPLRRWLSDLGNHNNQGEYYLTDIIPVAVADGVEIHAIQPEAAAEIRGVNDRVQLAEMERDYQRQQARELMLNGVTLMDPSRFDLRGELITGRDVSIDVNVVLEGSIRIGDNVHIGPNCYINNAEIGSNVTILADTVIEGALLGDGCRIGPFARIRPQTRLAGEVHVGNFVELKNAVVGRRSKINHLSYVGDSDIGGDVNIGAGTITCNYDGANKHHTVIGDDVQVGSDTQLIAPVRVGAGATIGAGTTVTRDVEAGSLVHNKTEWRTVQGWKRPAKKKTTKKKTAKKKK